MRPLTYDEMHDRLDRSAADVERRQQAADDACSEPRRFECGECGADRVFGRRCDCGSWKLREIRA